VQKEKIKLALKRDLRFGSILCRRFSRNHNITEKVGLDTLALAFLHGEGDHVGWAILAQVVTIDDLDRRIIDDQDRKLSLRTSRDA